MRNTSVQAVERAGTLLLYLAEHPGASLQELARAIGCSRTTAHRLLNALSRSGLVVAGPAGRPVFGPAVVRLYGAWCQQTELRHLAQARMRELRDRSGESVYLHIRQGDAIVCAEAVESTQPIGFRMGVGETAPPLHSSSGKLLLASLPPAEAAARLAALAPDDAEQRERLVAELARIREQGYATSNERIRGAIAVAAPIWNGGRELAGSLSIAGPAERLTPAAIAELAPVLRAVADGISHQLGYLPDAAGPRARATVGAASTP